MKTILILLLALAPLAAMAQLPLISGDTKLKFQKGDLTWLARVDTLAKYFQSASPGGIYGGSGVVPPDTYARTKSASSEESTFTLGYFRSAPNVNFDGTESGFYLAGTGVGLMNADSASEQMAYVHSLPGQAWVAASNAATNKDAWVFVQPTGINLVGDSVAFVGISNNNSVEAVLGLNSATGVSYMTDVTNWDKDASDDAVLSGTTNQVTYFTGANTVGSDGDLTFNGAQVGIGGDPNSSYRLRIKQSGTDDGIFIEKNSASTGLKLYESNGSFVESSSNISIKSTGGTIVLQPPGGGSFIQGVSVLTTVPKTDTLGGSTMFNIAGEYAPNVANVLPIRPSILRLGTNLNLHGAANQPMAGLLIEPTLTDLTSEGFRGVHYHPEAYTFLWQPGGDTVRSWLRGRLSIGPDGEAPGYRLDVRGTDGIRIPVGTTAQRPTGAAGVLRFNSDSTAFEGHTGSGWVTFGAGGGGGGGATNLSYSGSSSPVTLASSTGTDVQFLSGAGVTLSADSDELTIATTAPQPASSETIESSNFTATIRIINNVDCSGGTITVTPPASPAIGDRFAVVDGKAAVTSTKLIVVDFDTANQKLYSVEQNYTINVAGGYVEFIYMGTTTGWIATKG